MVNFNNNNNVDTSSVSNADLLQAALAEAMSSGASATDDVSEVQTEVHAQEDVQPVAEEQAQEEARTPQPQKDEYVYVTDESGQRKKIKVDYTPEKVRKAYEMAAGMRKFQAERDRLRKEMESLQQLKTDYEDLQQSWSALEGALREKGLAGLIDLLHGKEGYYDEFLARELERREYLKNASPAERERMQLEERLARVEREKARKEKEFQEYQEKLLREREAQEQLQLQNMINPAFNKYRFAGTLGDSILEERLDQAIWHQALSNLENLPDSVELTPALVEKEFREVASTFKKVINKQATQKTKEIVETRKANAQAAVAAKAASGMKQSYPQDVEQDIANGNLKGLLSKMARGFKL